MSSRKKVNYQKAAIVLGIALTVVFSWLPQTDRAAQEQIDQGLQRALISFASARALNAAISVAQGTEASIEPAGVGFTFTPGEVLDPVNDLVEKFSDLMLLASLSFGVQKVLTEMGAFWVVSLLLSLTAILWSRSQLLGLEPSTVMRRLLIILITVRFALPVISLGSDLIFDKFLAADYQTSQEFIDSSSIDLEEFNQSNENTANQSGVIEIFRNWSQNISFDSPIDELKETADSTIEHVVNLMVIFLLQTLLLPLLILWAIYNTAKRLIQVSSTANK